MPFTEYKRVRESSFLHGASHTALTVSDGSADEWQIAGAERITHPGHIQFAYSDDRQ